MFLAVALLLLSSTQLYASRLTDDVHHFEFLHYDKESLMWSHNRIRRSFEEPRNLRLSFQSFDQHFDFRLSPDEKYLHEDLELFVDGRKRSASLVKSHLYAGYDINDPSITVHGNLAFGVFDGAVHTEDDIYYIEPADRHLPGDEMESHSVIYRHSDLKSQGDTCGSTTREKQRYLAAIQGSAVDNGQFHKRQSTTRDKTKVRCWLNIMIDSLFYEHISSSDATEDYRITQATATVRNIISGTNQIYERVDFDEDGSEDGINFAIRSISVTTKLADDIHPDEFIGVEALLNLYSENDWSDFCLSYLFTYRDFDNGVLGLAFVAAAGSQGGLCHDYTLFTGGKYKTLNTGVVSLLNYGTRVTASVSVLTFAHEAGHNFGSVHDPVDDPECAPANGKYIMYAHATDGSHDNNKRFSPCSQKSMDDTIARVAQNDGGCFVTADDNCGNNILDAGEQCDCGGSYNWNKYGICRDDPCCNGTSCTLPSTAQCSPQQGSCCTSNCTFQPADYNMLPCREDSDCAYESTCNGTSAICPPGLPKDADSNSTFLACNDNSNYCIDGECTGSICIPLEMDDCECTEPELQCHVCCKNAEDDICMSTIKLAEMDPAVASALPNGEGQTKPVGHPCNNFVGYCDFFDVCQMVDSEGALSRFTDIITGNKVILSAFSVLMQYWWAGIVAVVVVLVAIFILVLSCHFLLPRPEHMKNRDKRRNTIQHSHMRRTTTLMRGGQHSVRTQDQVEMRK